MTSSIYLDREEELLLDKLAGVNLLSRNTVLRLALRQLAAFADATGRLPLASAAKNIAPPSAAKNTNET